MESVLWLRERMLMSLPVKISIFFQKIVFFSLTNDLYSVNYSSMDSPHHFQQFDSIFDPINFSKNFQDLKITGQPPLIMIEYHPNFVHLNNSMSFVHGIILRQIWHVVSYWMKFHPNFTQIRFCHKKLIWVVCLNFSK